MLNPTIAGHDPAPADTRAASTPPRRAQAMAAAAGTIGGLALFCGLALHAFDLSFPAQLTIFLNGHDANPGPKGALLGAWGLLWACAALATPTRSRRNQGRP